MITLNEYFHLNMKYILYYFYYYYLLVLNYQINEDRFELIVLVLLLYDELVWQ